MEAILFASKLVLPSLLGKKFDPIPSTDSSTVAPSSRDGFWLQKFKHNLPLLNGAYFWLLSESQ